MLRLPLEPLLSLAAMTGAGLQSVPVSAESKIYRITEKILASHGRGSATLVLAVPYTYYCKTHEVTSLKMRVLLLNLLNNHRCSID